MRFFRLNRLHQIVRLLPTLAFTSCRHWRVSLVVIMVATVFASRISADVFEYNDNPLATLVVDVCYSETYQDDLGGYDFFTGSGGTYTLAYGDSLWISDEWDSGWFDYGEWQIYWSWTRDYHTCGVTVIWAPEVWAPFDEVTETGSTEWVPGCSEFWEDQQFLQSRHDYEWHRVGERSNYGNERNVNFNYHFTVVSQAVQGCKPLNTRSYDRIVQDWHDVGSGMGCDWLWEDQGFWNVIPTERVRRVGWENDRDGETSGELVTDSSGRTAWTQGCKPLNWRTQTEVASQEALGNWSPSCNSYWEDQMFDQRQTIRKQMHSWRTNDRGDITDHQYWTEDTLSPPQSAHGCKPLNWRFWENRMARDWYDDGSWAPTATSRYFWEDVNQSITRSQDWEEWQTNDRGESRLLRLFVISQTFFRTVPGTKIPSLSALALELPGSHNAAVSILPAAGTVSMVIDNKILVLQGNVGGSGAFIYGSPLAPATVTTGGGATTVVTSAGPSSLPAGGTIDLGGGVTVSATAGGNAILTVPGGPSIAVGQAGGSLTLPGGTTIRASTSGRVDIDLPPGSSPVVAKAVDVAGQIINGAAGHIISVRDAISLVVGPLPPNPALDAIDIGITASGMAQIGLRQGRDGPTIWVPIHVNRPPRLHVDANRDGIIQINGSDQTSMAQPYRFWLNDNFDSGGTFVPADGLNAAVDGYNDLKKDFFPVFLDIKQLLNAHPPSSGAIYKLKHADGALNFIYTDLTRATAFAYESQDQLDPANPPYPLSAASTMQITPQGTVLSTSFLNSIKDGDMGVLLMEGRGASTQPLTLTVERNGGVIAQAILPLSLGQDIVLLLHGMNSNTQTWDVFVDNPSAFYGSAVDVRDGAIHGSSPMRNSAGIRCYRVQFGAFDMASTRIGVEGVTSGNTLGYDTVGVRCGDFETFAELGQEVEDAISLLVDRHPNARFAIVGHSRGGIAARAFLQKPGNTSQKAAVIGVLTTSSPHLGSSMGRINQWLDSHKRGTPQGHIDDWQVVDWLIQPTVAGVPKPPLDVRRPVIFDVSDNSPAIANLNAPTSVQNLPRNIRYGEIIYSNARFGVLSTNPVRYSVFEQTGVGMFFPQLSSAAKSHLMNGGSPGDVQFIGDGLIPEGRQRFTHLPNFPGIVISPRIVVDREVVHNDAPDQVVDLIEQLESLVPAMFP